VRAREYLWHNLVCRPCEFVRARRQSVAYVIVAVACIFGLLRVELLARQTHGSFCDLKRYRERELAQMQAYYEMVAAGRREIIPGITLVELRAAIADEQDLLNALADLDC